MKVIKDHIAFLLYIIFLYKNRGILYNIRNELAAHQRTLQAHLSNISELLQFPLPLKDGMTDNDLHSILNKFSNKLFSYKTVIISESDISKVLDNIRSMIFTCEHNQTKIGFKSGEHVTIYNELKKYLFSFPQSAGK